MLCELALTHEPGCVFPRRPSHRLSFCIRLPHTILKFCSTFYSPDNDLLSSRSKLYLLWFALIGLLMFLS